MLSKGFVEPESYLYGGVEMRRTVLFGLVVLALLMAACSPQTVVVKETVVVQGTPEVKEVEVTKEVVKEVVKEVEVLALPEVDPLSVTGDIVTAGSSTVFPLSERMAERFQDEGYADNITPCLATPEVPVPNGSRAG